MAGTRKTRVPMVEQIRLINECRQSGMTDADWCRENDIAVSTFYNWVSRWRKTAADQIPAANYGHLEVPRPKHTASQMLSWREFDWLMSGIAIDQPKALKAE